MLNKLTLKQAFQTLELKESASLEEAKRKFRKLAHLYHPDHTDDPRKHVKFQKIQESYHLIKKRLTAIPSFNEGRRILKCACANTFMPRYSLIPRIAFNGLYLEFFKPILAIYCPLCYKKTILSLFLRMTLHISLRFWQKKFWKAYIKILDSHSHFPLYKNFDLNIQLTQSALKKNIIPLAYITLEEAMKFATTLEQKNKCQMFILQLPPSYPPLQNPWKHTKFFHQMLKGLFFLSTLMGISILLFLGISLITLFL